MSIKKNLLTITILLFSICALAQNSAPVEVSGVVRDESGTIIANATVNIEKSNLTTATDEKGNFRFKNVKPGKYVVIVKAMGFNAGKKEINVDGGKNVTLNFQIESTSTELDQVSVTGLTAVQETNRQAYNITAVDAKKLYNSTLNLADALDRVSGVRVRESGGVGSNFNLSLNGFSGNHVRFFIDGIPMDNFGTSFQINNIPINIAERLEVYKGVVPIWLGSDALGGAINIITGNRYRNYIDVSYSYGSFNTHRSVINAAVTSKSGLTFQLSAFQNYSDNDYKVKIDAADINTGKFAPSAYLRRFHDTYHNETVIASVGLVGKSYADKLLLGITLGKNYKEIQTGARMISVFGGWHRRGDIVMPTLKYKKDNLIKGLDVTLNANYNLGSEQNIDTMNVRFDWLGNSKPLGSNGERSRSLYKYKNNNGIVNTMLNYRLGENQSIAVSDVFTTFNRKGSDELNPDVTANETPKKTQKNILGIGYSYNIKDVWSATVFGKSIYQNNSDERAGTTSTSKFGYGVAATYFLNKNLQIKTSYELTNRMPEAQEIFGDVENQEGNPNLQPEQSQNVNLGVSYSFAANRNSRFMINANGIFRNSDNFIYNRLNNNQSKLVADNRDGVRTFGADGEVRYSYKNWLSLGTSVTYQYLQNLQMYERDANGKPFTTVSALYGDQMPNIPFFFGNSDVSVTLKDVGKKGNNLNLGYNLLYVHAFYLYWPSLGGAGTDDKYGIPMQLSHDVNIVYSVAGGKYNISLEGRNLTNVLLYDNFSLQKPGRGFYLNLRYFLNKTNN